MTLDYARAVGDAELEALVAKRAKDFYLQDRNYNGAFEPSGEDFFSAAWTEAGPADAVREDSATRFTYEVRAGWETRRQVGFLVREGETLLLPAYWHHEVFSHAAHVEGQQEDQPLNVAVNFWFRNETQPPAGFL